MKKPTISTGMEKTFKLRQDGLYQEVFNHFIHFMDKDGNKITKLDKVMGGRLYREAKDGEHSFNGEAEWLEPNSGRKLKLVAL